MEGQEVRHSPVFTPSSPTSCMRTIPFLSKMFMDSWGPQTATFSPSCNTVHPQPRLHAGLSSQRGSRSSKGREKHSCYNRPRPSQRCSHRTATPPHRRDVTSQELALVREGSDLLISRAWGLGAPNSIIRVTLEHWAQESHQVSHLPPTLRSHPDLSSHIRMSPPDPTESYLPTSLTGSGAEINQWG